MGQQPPGGVLDLCIRIPVHARRRARYTGTLLGHGESSQLAEIVIPTKIQYIAGSLRTKFRNQRCRRRRSHALGARHGLVPVSTKQIAKGGGGGILARPVDASTPRPVQDFCAMRGLKGRHGLLLEQSRRVKWLFDGRRRNAWQVSGISEQTTQSTDRGGVL